MSLPEQHLAVPSVTVLGRFTFRKSCSQKLFFRCAGISVRSSFSKEFSKTFKVLFNYQGSCLPGHLQYRRPAFRSARFLSHCRDDLFSIANLFLFVNSFFTFFSKKLLFSSKKELHVTFFAIGSFIIPVFSTIVNTCFSFFAYLF